LASGQDELGVGAFDGLLEQAAFEHLAAAFDARFEASGEIGVLLGQGQFEADLGLKDQSPVLDLDCLGGDRSLKLRGGVRMVMASVGAVVLPCALLYLFHPTFSRSTHRLATGRKKLAMRCRLAAPNTPAYR